MKIKAKLKVILIANENEIAESTDPVLWQKVLLAITSSDTTNKVDGIIDVFDNKGMANVSAPKDNKVSKFSGDINVPSDIVKETIDPSRNAPYLDIDKKTWAKWNKNTPKRGVGAVGSSALVATVMALWFDSCQMGKINTRMVAKVLYNLGDPSKNPTRTINNCTWLQLKKKIILLKPSEINSAIEVARAFCKGEVPKLKDITNE